MATDVTVTVPLDVTAALQQTADPSKLADAIATITKAVVEEEKALSKS